MSTSQFHRVVVAWDGSPDAQAAVDLALRLVGHDGAVDALVVVDPGEGTETRGSHDRAVDAGRQQAEEALEPFLERAAHAHTRLRLVFVEGDDPVHAMLHHADHHGADLIVVGRRGSSGRLHSGLGPVASGLAAKGRLPVLVTGE
jgi:nucleotide-binding universal stress UspA family protein